eukprot:94692-Amphidinium_carterae.1
MLHVLFTCARITSAIRPLVDTSGVKRWRRSDVPGVQQHEQNAICFHCPVRLPYHPNSRTGLFQQVVAIVERNATRTYIVLAQLSRRRHNNWEGSCFGTT